MACSIGKSIFKLAAVVTVFVVVSNSTVRSQVHEHSMFGLLQMIVSPFLENLPIGCHSPFRYRKGLMSSGGVSDYYSEPPHDINTTLIGWYFFKRDGVCKPLYKKTGVKPFDCNKGLPKTKDECDTNCVKPCFYEVGMPNGRTHIKEGIYSYDEYCVGGNHPVACDGNCPPKIPLVTCCEVNFNWTIKSLPTVNSRIDASSIV